MERAISLSSSDMCGAKKVGDRGDLANSCRSGDRGPRVAGTVGEREREVEKDRVKSERRIRLEGTREGFENRTWIMIRVHLESLFIQVLYIILRNKHKVK